MREPEAVSRVAGSIAPHFRSLMAPVTQLLLIANIATFFGQSFAESTLIANFALWPFHVPAGTFDQDVRFAPWQLVTYSFLHGNVMHLAFNMLALFMFGSDIERL